MKLTRREFLQGCSYAIAALAGARLTNIAYAAPDDPADTLVVVFLRGGWDALNVVPPLMGDDRGWYEKARPSVKIADRKLINLNDAFGLHPALSPLHELYQDGKMGIVHAVGLNYDTRSHFDAMEFIELGTPGSKATTSGWITRHLQTAPGGSSGLLPAVAAPSQPTALLGTTATVSMSSPGDLSQWDNGLLSEQQSALRKLYRGDSLLHQSGLRTLDATAAIAPLNEQEYNPQNGASYREDELGTQLKTVAQLIKMQAGLRVATVDFGGWDTHEDQNYDEGGYMGGLLESLGQNLANFYRDLDSGYTDKLSVVVLSEFGRRLTQNDSNGTDHGYGSVMLALGGGINGGQVHGSWPGLANEQLYDRADLAVTTDYRQVLGELLINRLKNPNLETIFPGYGAGFSPLGLFK
ncbi:MAG: hypothetical protein CVU44_08310 [Chloroflexi bacterium HGW-Chloroflexi-6]|nr:MAG: hypothetical protein CVU44_08310 [Chloroflexi bacterium HGW-Chloroflexi-6]